MYHFKSYEEKLKDPRWRERRNEILFRDGYSCQRCGTFNYSNEVHHVAYEKGWEPWEYPDEYLMTLCRDCHQKETDDWLDIQTTLLKMKLSGILSFEIKSKINIKF